MEIHGPPSSHPAPRLSAPESWPLGRVLQALVIRQTAPGSAILQIGAQQLLAETSKPLSAGQRLTLTVTRTGATPLLQANLADDGAPLAAGARPTAPGDNATVISSLLKQALPQQGSMNGLLANIAMLSQQPPRTLPLPAAALDAIRQLYRQLPAADKVTDARQLRQAIADSGLFLENRLAKAAGARTALAPVENDLKAALLRLLGVLRQATGNAPQTTTATASPPRMPPAGITQPTLRGHTPQAQARAEPMPLQAGVLQLLLELGRQTEAALARTQLHQAASLPGSETGGNSWALELPLRHGQQVDLFDMVIEQEQQRGRNDEQAQPAWSVSLAFDLDGLGAVHARVHLREGKIATLFWAEEPATAALFNKHLAELSQRYREAGLECGELRCFEGEPPDGTQTPSPRIVLDVKA